MQCSTCARGPHHQQVSILRPSSSKQRILPVAAVSISPISRKAQRRQRRQLGEGNGLGTRQPAPPAAPPPSPSPSSPSPAPVSSVPTPNADILEAFFYGRAFAMTLSKRLGEAVVDLAAEISKAAAERPQKVQEFQEEVRLLARRDMEASAVPMRPTQLPVSRSSSSSSASPAGSANGAAGAQAQDLQAMVDDLRAEIAYSRAICQQIRTGGLSGAVPGQPPRPARGASVESGPNKGPM